MLEALALGHAYAPGVPALREVSIRVAPGEVVGLSGPSGIGKTTLGRLLAGRLRPQAGSVRLDGQPLPERGFRPVQYLAQHPVLDMNPRWRVARVLAEAGRPDPALAARLGIDPAWEGRYPHELSGGQLQRVSLVRALGPRTRFLVADEISAPLDAIAQADLWRLLLALCAERGLGILAISHDAALLARIASRRVTLGG
ncbi:ATP-binding cassette domain-containing protein [Aureimonas flava]|uniref:ATP-binding cassette domain-containing protein n=1 Tax=Aureimonas flava TaxID=2320271 RepID=A0A3A1WNK8_9HYPH|nr:ATP-binding cassette domain-containing protein [Aureimonas flava]RIY02659.1 ATP-binding cassette domain-containing protein [Aureimonas flava]